MLINNTIHSVYVTPGEYTNIVHYPLTSVTKIDRNQQTTGIDDNYPSIDVQIGQCMYHLAFMYKNTSLNYMS